MTQPRAPPSGERFSCQYRVSCEICNLDLSCIQDRSRLSRVQCQYNFLKALCIIMSDNMSRKPTVPRVQVKTDIQKVAYNDARGSISRFGI